VGKKSYGLNSEERTMLRKVLVIVHGGGDFSRDYHKPLVAAVESELGAPCNCIPVYYADIGSASKVMGAAAPIEQEQFEKRFVEELQRSLSNHPIVASTSGRNMNVAISSLPAPIKEFNKLAKEVGRYLFTPGFTTQVQERLMAGLGRATQEYDATVLVTHSLGTVVAFDVLRQFAARFKILHWLTCGCPLAKLRKLNVGRFADPSLSAITRENVERWYNIYDTSDFIADPIGPAFPLPGYRIHDIFVDVADDPYNSHDYFSNAETINIIAEALK
jgi:hypothetical protein